MKQYPNLISKTEAGHSDILFATNQMTSGNNGGFISPVYKDKKIVKSTIVRELNKTDIENQGTPLTVHKNAEILFHELGHDKDHHGLTIKENMERKGPSSHVDMKGYFDSNSERSAREAQYKGIHERLGPDGEQVFRDMHNYKQERFVNDGYNKETQEDVKQYEENKFIEFKTNNQNI